MHLEMVKRFPNEVRSMIFMFWINRKGKYPYVSRETWVTRYWLLRRKIAAQHEFVTPSDRRVSAELLRLAPPAAPRFLVRDLHEVVFNAPDPNPYYSDAAQEEDLGS